MPDTASDLHTLLSSQTKDEDVQTYSNTAAEHEEAIERIVSRFSSKAGQLGPLEEPIDAESEINVSGNGDVNELDPWKYSLDPETGVRLVQFVQGDDHDPRNWSNSKKWFVTIVLGIMCFAVTLCSSAVTGDVKGPMKSFNVSSEVVTLTVTLFVIGFGVGPLVFSPLSEEVGRRWMYCSTYFFGVIFIIPCAVAPNIGTLLVCRLIDGIAFSAPITVIGGTLADIFLAGERGQAMAVFSAAPFLGPILGPIIGGFIGDNVGWRWIYWVLLIFTGVVFIFVAGLVPETHHQTILKYRKNKLIKLTGDTRYKIIKDLKPRTVGEIAKETVSRPLILLTELIVFLLTIYMSIMYGLIYMFFFAYPVVFIEGKGWSDSMTGLMFIGTGIGVFIGVSLCGVINNDYKRRSAPYAARGELTPPELRLIPMMAGCWLVPVGLFIFAWTSYPRLNWVGPAIAGIPCGLGFLLVYNSANNYIVDSYQHYAASALASKTLVRSIHGATCVLYTVQMMHKLTDKWALSLMAFISLACCAIPFLFFFKGAVIRRRSRYAYAPDTSELDQNLAAKSQSSEEKSSV